MKATSAASSTVVNPRSPSSSEFTLAATSGAGQQPCASASASVVNGSGHVYVYSMSIVSEEYIYYIPVIPAFF